MSKSSKSDNRENPTTPPALNFARLNDQRFEVRSDRDFQSVAQLMNDRFGGLPSFHSSVRLNLLEEQKLIADETGQLEIPALLAEQVEPHLRADLDHLVDTINRGEGVKSLGILRLEIGLNQEFARQQLDEMGDGTHPWIRKMARWVGSHVRVPILLAVASRKSEEQYESLAVGVRGVTRYSSALVVRPHQVAEGGSPGVYEVTGGLEAQVQRENIDHPISALLVACGERVLPRGFFNRYLQRYMVPERRTIVTRLCHYVFSGLQELEAKDSPCTVIAHDHGWQLAS